jgi:hypothetical protein
MAEKGGVRNARGRRAAVFLLGLAAGLLLMTAAFLGAVAGRAGDARLFRSGLERYVAARGILSQSDADVFAAGTVAYLNGETDAWPPSVTYGDHPLAVPEAFTAHMAAVRSWMAFARAAVPAAVAAALVLLTLALLLCGRGGAWRPAIRGYYAGAALPVLLALAACGWGVFDFNGFWAWLHETFIPGGIFYAGEEIMQLFPLNLFADYLGPVGAACGLYAGLTLLAPPFALGLRRLGRGRRATQTKKDR